MRKIESRTCVERQERLHAEIKEASHRTHDWHRHLHRRVILLLYTEKRRQVKIRIRQQNEEKKIRRNTIE